MFLLDREYGGTDKVPTGTFSIAGTTGNVYKVEIGNVPSCKLTDVD
jgi:hypothetical protein